MSGYDIYVFCLCFITLLGFAGVLGYLLLALLKTHVKAVKAGMHDEELKKEYGTSGCLNSIATFVFCLIFIAVFLFALAVNITGDMFFEDIPTLKMVNTGSMSKKHEKNGYLFENGLDNQIQTFDLVMVYKTPEEEALKPYDVILYSVDNAYIIHRIIAIEEPNEKHPEERYFLCRGDANESSDRFPVLYSQIKGIYRGARIPFVGSFVVFLQSPAGWLCLILVLLVTFIMPKVDKRLEKLHRERLIEIEYIDRDGQRLPETVKLESEPKNERIVITRTLQVNAKPMSVSKKLIYANGQNQDRFTEIDNLFRSCENVSTRTSYRAISYCIGRKTLAKLLFNGRTIRLQLALDPQSFDYNKYFQKDMSDIKAYANIPFSVKIKSERGVKRALELVLAVCEKFGAKPNPDYIKVNSIRLLRKEQKKTEKTV